jgi:phage-related protein
MSPWVLEQKKIKLILKTNKFSFNHMGFGDFFSKGWATFTSGLHNAVTQVSLAAGKVYSGITNTYTAVANKAVDAVSTVYGDVKGAYTTVYNDAKDLVHGVANTAEHVFDKGVGALEHIVDKGGETLSGVASSLSMPITIGLGVGGLILGFVLLKK